jgi:enolase 1/2/3
MEILSSSGKPTVRATVETENNIQGTASVPIGSSRGKHEAHYLYDGGKRFQGLGVRKAVANIGNVIAPALNGYDVCCQKEIDNTLIKLDGSEDKSVLGANAMLAVSLAAARAGAKTLGMPLFRYIGGEKADTIPVVAATVIAGGKFSPSDLDFEDYLYVLCGFDSFMDGLEALVGCYYRLAETITKKYGPIPTIGGGAMSPPLKCSKEAFDLMMETIIALGLEGKIKLGLDIVGGELMPTQSSFYMVDRKKISEDEYISYLETLIDMYPISFLEDPFGEDDFKAFSRLTERVGNRVMVVGDDLFVSNPKRLQKGIEAAAGNSLLLKMNQIGTLSESIEAARMAQKNDYEIMVSVRSSDTNDSFASDLAVALSAGYIKIGSPVAGEKMSKYNRLLEIEAMIKG